jgi:cyclopropane fatty-acyl-phospholipid synthase-like methyltransferase
VTRDWHEWYRDYDDPTSSLSQRLAVVRSHLASLLAAAAPGPVRLLSLCAGDGRDALPVIAESGVEVAAVLVELDPDLSAAARASAAELGLTGVEVRTADAGDTSCAAGAVPADVVMACGVFGNLTEDDVRRTVATLPSLLAPGGAVIWTRGCRVPEDPSELDGDPAENVRSLFAAAGFDEWAFVRPEERSFRVGVHRWPGPSAPYTPDVRIFEFE